MTGQRLCPQRLAAQAQQVGSGFAAASPFPHLVIDDFLPREQADQLSQSFPTPDQPIWADWRQRTGHQYGKQGTRNSDRFDLLSDRLYFSLLDFNSSVFLQFLQAVTGLDALLPDPYFQGGGLHQIVSGGILDIHTDFNDYQRLKLYRRLNVLLYLTEAWTPADGGELELWDGPPPEGAAWKQIAPKFNRLVIFRTDNSPSTDIPGNGSRAIAPADRLPSTTTQASRNRGSTTTPAPIFNRWCAKTCRSAPRNAPRIDPSCGSGHPGNGSGP